MAQLDSKLMKVASILSRADIPAAAKVFGLSLGESVNERWRMDCTGADPSIRVALVDELFECDILVSPADLDVILERRLGAEELPTFTRRLRILAENNEIVCGVFYALLEASGVHGSIDASDYDQLARFLPDQDFVLMNHGYVSLTENEDFGWVKLEDELWKYSLNLVRDTLHGIDLRGRRILDVGCGRGGASSYLVRYHEPARVLGLDYSEEAVRVCSRTHQFPNLRFVQGDAQDLPFSNGEFDVVLNIESSHCYPDIKQFFFHVHRVLVPGGYFCYTDNSGFPASRFERLLTQAGFELLDYKEITANVARAMELSRPHLERFLLSRVGPDNQQVVRNLLRGLYVTMQSCYTTRSLLYHSWLLRVPPTSVQS